MEAILNKLLIAKGQPDLLNFLLKDLTGSELNTLLLALHRARAQQKTASQLVREFENIRFTQPVEVDVLSFKKEELSILEILEKNRFELLECSPLTPLGTSSVYGTVHQNNVVSALRHTEVVSDITNVLALDVASRIKSNPSDPVYHLSTAHRLVRAQGYDEPAYTAHFKVAACVSCDKDRGNFLTEVRLVEKHLLAYLQIFKDVYTISNEALQVTIRPVHDSNILKQSKLVAHLKNKFEDLDVVVEPIEDPSFTYYHTLRISLQLKKWNIPIVDAGFVNWLSVLTGNQKMRFFISGMGTELLHKLIAQAPKNR